MFDSSDMFEKYRGKQESENDYTVKRDLRLRMLS